MIRQTLIRLSSVTGLITVPGTIALSLWLLSWPFLKLDRWIELRDPMPFGGQLVINYDTATALLSTISAAAMTTLSLVYSIVLVVFTLAAGNIAPRLLQRFTKDRVNQVTAGLLGGTFLFSLTLLHQTSATFVPSISIAFAFLLAVLAVLQLIFFVHAVSRSVTIDEEVAEISQTLEERLNQIAAEEGVDRKDLSQFGNGAWDDLRTRRSGYLSVSDSALIVSVAEACGSRVEITAKPGTFLLEGQAFARFNVDDVNETERDKLTEAIYEATHQAASRGAQDDVEYAISLLIEIALRALSPGVNDTFTAVACVDRLSAAYQDITARGLRQRLVSDSEGHPRVIISGMNVEDMINTAFNPLRRAAASNALMMQHIGDALMRLHDIARDDVRPCLKDQLERVLDEFESTNPLSSDAAFLRERFEPVLRS